MPSNGSNELLHRAQWIRFLLADESPSSPKWLPRPDSRPVSEHEMILRPGNLGRQARVRSLEHAVHRRPNPGVSRGPAIPRGKLLRILERLAPRPLGLSRGLVVVVLGAGVVGQELGGQDVRELEAVAPTLRPGRRRASGGGRWEVRNLGLGVWLARSRLGLCGCLCGFAL